VSKTQSEHEALAHNLLQNHAYQPCVLTPRDPVIGVRPKRSHGMYGPHTSRRLLRYGLKRVVWYERPVDIEILQGTPHALILPAFLTMWARVVG
jgi:hypothetical protein